MPHRPVATRLALIALLALLCLATTAATPAMAAVRPLASNVVSFALSRSDARVVYLAKETPMGATELFSVPVAGGAPLKLNAPLAAGTDVAAFKVSPASAGGLVVYIARHAADSAPRLYSVSTSGGAPVALADAQSLGAGFDPFTLTFAPDGSQLLFRIQRNQLGPQPLYRVAPTGGAPVLIANNVARFWAAPDSTRVVFDESFGQAPGLKSVPLDGSLPVETLGISTETSDLLFTDGGSHVVYIAGTDSGAQVALVRQAAAGGPQTPLYTPGSGELINERFVLVPASDRIAFVTRGAGGVIVLRSVRLRGSDGLVLDSVQENGPANVSIEPYPAAGRVVYLVSRTTSIRPPEGTRQLKSVPVLGGTPITLRDLGSTAINSFIALDTDFATVAFSTTGGVFAGPADGPGALAQLSQSTAGAGPLFSDAGRVVFVDGAAMVVARRDGGSTERISLPGGLLSLDLQLLGDAAIYLGRSGEDGQLYAVDLPTPDRLPFKTHLPLLRR
jgi:hypothetical protein